MTIIPAVVSVSQATCAEATVYSGGSDICNRQLFAVAEATAKNDRSGCRLDVVHKNTGKCLVLVPDEAVVDVAQCQDVIYSDECLVVQLKDRPQHLQRSPRYFQGLRDLGSVRFAHGQNGRGHGYPLSSFSVSGPCMKHGIEKYGLGVLTRSLQSDIIAIKPCKVNILMIETQCLFGGIIKIRLLKILTKHIKRA